MLGYLLLVKLIISCRLPYIFLRLNTLKGTEKTPVADLMRLKTLRNIAKPFNLKPLKVAPGYSPAQYR